MRYIDANKLLTDELTHTLPAGFGELSGKHYVFVEDIEKQPTVDVVEVRHGRWVNNHCTVCGMTPIGEETWTNQGVTPPKYEMFMSFCPCCGAKMDGERREENEG